MAQIRIRLLAYVVLVAAALSCGPADDPSVMRFATDDFDFKVWPDVSPPRAIERITYTIVVKDKETQEPIVNGEGRIFATNRDRKSIANGFKYGPEVGTYRTTVTFVTAGDWMMGIQFRRDSTQVLQRTHDWRQFVRNEAPPGQ